MRIVNREEFLALEDNRTKLAKEIANLTEEQAKLLLDFIRELNKQSKPICDT